MTVARSSRAIEARRKLVSHPPAVYVCDECRGRHMDVTGRCSSCRDAKGKPKRTGNNARHSHHGPSMTKASALQLADEAAHGGRRRRGAA